ncbi:putative transcription factor WD40-like family [Helianthus anomalus]
MNSVTDLLKSETLTLPFQSSSNISRIAASPDGVFLIAIDDNGRCQFINLRPNGEFIIVGLGKLVEIWRSPGLRTFANCDNKVTYVDWSPDPDSRYLLAGSKDLTIRLFCLKKDRGEMPYFVCIHLLLESRVKITTTSFNELGNWFLIVLVIKRL